MEPGRAEVLREGEQLCIWAFGALNRQVLEATERLARRGVEVGVVDARFAKPLDTELLNRHLRRYRFLLTVEEHQRAGGFGSAVLEAASRVPDAKARVRVCAIPDRYIDHMTTRDEQLAEVGLDSTGLERIVLSLLRPSPVV